LLVQPSCFDQRRYLTAFWAAEAAVACLGSMMVASSPTFLPYYRSVLTVAAILLFSA